MLLLFNKQVVKMSCYILVFMFIVSNKIVYGSYHSDLAWTGGPVHMACEHNVEFWKRSGQYVKENVIATKAAIFKDNVYVITPRMKHGVLATVWQLIRGRQGVEFQACPDLRSHSIADCSSVQNAVDFFLDHLGNIWVLDSGIIETLESPRCTCQPKVVVISLLFKKITRIIDLASLTEPTSILQNIVVEYALAKTFVYISDASRGAVLVHEVAVASEWSVIACAPSSGLQLALVRKGPTHAVLILVRMHYPGVYELDTAALRRKNSLTPLRVLGEHSQPIFLLGSDNHFVYLRHAGCADVLSWDSHVAYNGSSISNIHSPGPNLTPTSVAADPYKHVTIVLDSNYAEAVQGNAPTYHRITFIE